MDAVQRLLKLNRLEVWKIPSGQIAVSYQDAEIKDGDFLVGTFGVGNTFNEACEDYMNKISGKRLVFHAWQKSRQEVVVL